MTGREKLLAAFTSEGTPEMGAVAPNEWLFIRDHYAALTQAPWWDPMAEDSRAQSLVTETGLEWFCIGACPSRKERTRKRYEQRGDGVWQIDDETGQETQLAPPMPSGANTTCSTSIHIDTEALPSTKSAIDDLIVCDPVFDRDAFIAEGRHDAAEAIRSAVDVFLYGHISSPLWSLYNLFGYEGMLLLMAQNPDLASYAGQRILSNATQHIRMCSVLGADGIRIEECLLDQISPESFRDINVPILRECVEEIRAAGMKSIYYYCGNPWDRFDAILDIGADAIQLEESKKGFTIDIEDVVEAVKGSCVLFGNLDATAVLQDGSDDELHREIERQLQSGKDNKNRFVMSVGSPITPDTPVERVRRYTDLVHMLQK